MSYNPAEKFQLTEDQITIVKRAEGPRTLLSDEILADGYRRVLEGEDIEKVALELAHLEMELTDTGDEDENELQLETASGESVEDTADAHVPAVRAIVRYAFNRAKRKSKDGEDAMIAALKDGLEPLEKALLHAWQSGEHYTSKRMRVAEEHFVIRVAARKKSLVSGAAWAKKHAAELISDISDTSRKRIKSAVASLVEGGDWNKNLEVILKAVGDDDRAELIAQHETMTAVSVGRRSAWREAADTGTLTGQERRLWVRTSAEKYDCVCPKLEGETAPLDGTYPGGHEGPPAHVNCRCYEEIVG